MSDTDLEEWRKTSLSHPKPYVLHRTPTPQRKAYFSEFRDVVKDYPHVALAKGARRISTFPGHDSPVEAAATARLETNYPLYLIKAFRAGCIAFAVGAILLLITIFYDGDAIKISGAAFLALGSVTVVFTLLRGQELDERNV